MIPVCEPRLAGNELNYVRDCIASGWISSAGVYIERFEQCWADYCGAEHGVAVSSGTAALQLAIDSLGLEPGDEVIMPSFTIISCALAVLRAGAVPVVVDCDPATYCIDADQVASAITQRTRAIMPVHMYGHPADLDPLLALAERHGLAIVEDAAQAHGCEYLSRREGGQQWRRCGGIGTLAAFSFYANKLVTTGEGGMVLTNDASLAERCRNLRNLGRQKTRFRHEELGYNFRMTNIQAAIGLAQVERIADNLQRKREIGTRYGELLSNIAAIRLPSQEDWARVNHWMYAIVLVDDVGMDAPRLAERLKERGVDSRPLFLGMHQQPALRGRGVRHEPRLPVTERLRERGLYLPSGLTLTDTQIETVTAAVRDSLASRV